MTMEKQDKTKKKQRAAAFLNWEIKLANGTTLKSDRGFPIFQNPNYPNAKEDLLIAATNKTEKGILELDMKVRIALNAPEEDSPLTADDLFASAAISG